MVKYIKLLWWLFNNRARLASLFDEARAIAADFAKENPEVPMPWKPTTEEVVEAIVAKDAGKAPFTPKPVKDWTMREWENYWSRASGTGEY